MATIIAMSLPVRSRFMLLTLFCVLALSAVLLSVRYYYQHERVVDLRLCLPPTRADVHTSTVSTRSSFYPSKFVSIRAVYIDDRPRSGHKNATVFLANILKSITDNKLIVGCQVGKFMAKDFEVRLTAETPFWRNWDLYPENKDITHEEVMIDCFDVPANDGDQGFLFYRTSKNSETIKEAVSERPVSRPRPRVQPSSPEGIKYNFTVLTCTKVFSGGAPWFLEWLRYQKHIGVDHVHIDVDESFFRDLSPEKMAFVNQEMESGFLTIQPWVMWLADGKEVWYHNQGLILEDCGYRFRGTYDFMFIVDTDEFFIPRIPNEPKVHFYLDKYFKQNTGSCKFLWIEYYPDKYLNNAGLSDLSNGNVTSLLTDFTHCVQANRKSVHRTQVLIDTATHYAFKMTDGFQTVEASVKEAYVAHVRHDRTGREAPLYVNCKVPSLP